ncbi:MAG: leucyl/phenylalanyl-tRNA--protein transferase [Alphaproteobacteria bacterium]|nr:leucyl/phenylalanyl-tRNA--protein transferase [Alphaproteobacteria bacterium]
MTRLTPELLLRAYVIGVFPMAEDRHDPQLHWIDPDCRGILPLDAAHIPRRLARLVRQDRFAIRIDGDFAGVLAACAAPAPGRWSTWINDEIVRLYLGLHRLGRAHSVECWRDGALVGGLYGVSLGAAFFGESMFSRATDASKVALVHLVARLRYARFRLLDVQFVTRHLMRFGAIEIGRERYHALLAAALREAADFYSMPLGWSGAAVLQSITHRS